MSARVGDKVKSHSPCSKTLCCPHDWIGVITEGSNIGGVNDRPAARLGDHGQTNCPHGGVFRIIQGSPDTYIDERPAARVGDMVQCEQCGSQGFIMKGSDNHFINTDGPSASEPRGR